MCYDGFKDIYIFSYIIYMILCMITISLTHEILMAMNGKKTIMNLQ